MPEPDAAGRGPCAQGAVGAVLQLSGTLVDPGFLQPDIYQITLWSGLAGCGYYTGKSRAARRGSRWDARMSGIYRVMRCCE